MSNDKTTTHNACNELISILLANGVKNVVISPGSRNAPLVVAFARCEAIKKYIIVDERSAAFTALGIAQQLNEPVVIVCTSGSALLNYAPAVSEAYYQQIPLIVISADRPIEWIDQDDSQTIRQYEALSKFVKKSYDIPAHYDNDSTKWYINRTLNEAVLFAIRGRKAPIHINIQLKEPLCDEIECKNTTRIINYVDDNNLIDTAIVNQLSKTIVSSKKVLIVAALLPQDDAMSEIIKGLAMRDNIVVLTETITNINSDKIISTIDRTLSAMPNDQRDDFKPDLLITIGGALITRMLKQFLRKHKPQEHWHVAISENIIDAMQSLTTHININANSFFAQIDKAIYNTDSVNSNYSKIWREIDDKASATHNKFVANADWCDLKAFSIILPKIPSNYHLQLSNGTSIRYAQLFQTPHIKRSNCNRGVAGIDGSTSTALGASLAYEGVTLLISGDMSLSYDISGLASQYNNPNFKIIVICNSGGGIFRFIKGPSDLPELEKYFEVNRDIPVEKYAQAFGFDYFEANSEYTLETELDKFFNHKDKASILAVYTPNKVNAEVLRQYFNRNK